MKRQKRRKPAWIKALRPVLACAREKTIKNYKKTGLKSARLWVTRRQGFYTPPPASPVGERRLRRKHPGTQCHRLHAHAGPAVPLAPAVALGFLGLLLLVLDHLGMGEHRFDRAGHVIGLMACLAGR